MSRQLLNLRNVPDDEAEDVRAFLDEHGIEYYETPPSRWWLSMGAIWIRREDDYPRARKLMDGYQAKRAARARAEYADEVRRGEVDTFADVLRRRPAQVLAYLALSAGILVVMALPAWVLLR